MTTTRRKIMVFGENGWSSAKTITEAKQKAKRYYKIEGKWVIYIDYFDKSNSEDIDPVRTTFLQFDGKKFKASDSFKSL